MAIFNKPPAKKPEPAKPAAKPGLATAAAPRTPVSARDVAAQAQARRPATDRPRAEPAGDLSMTGASLIEWSPARAASIEVGPSNSGMCAVLENAALLYASGQSAPARDMLERGVQSDIEAKGSPLAWLALFDLLQRADDRAAFERMSLQYVVQFERSAPSWEEGGKHAAPEIAPARGPAAGGYV